MGTELEQEPNTDTLVNRVAAQLRQRVMQLSLKENDFFMTEADVIAEFGVSRSIAREAISQLRAIGALKSRQAKGLLIGRSDPVRLLAESLPFCAKDPTDFAALSQFRYVLETGSVDLFVANATEAQIDQLDAIVEEFKDLAAAIEKSSPEEHIKDLERVDLAFHRQLLEMGNTPLLFGLHGVLIDFFQAESIQGPAPDFTTVGMVLDHQLIAQAVRARNAELCRALLRYHLRKLVKSENK